MANISKLKLPGSDTVYDLKDANAAPLQAPQFVTKTESEVTIYPRSATVTTVKSSETVVDTTDSSNKIATTEWVQAVLNAVVGYSIDPTSHTISVSPLDTIADNNLTLNSTAAEITHVSGDEYAFNIVV